MTSPHEVWVKPHKNCGSFRLTLFFFMVSFIHAFPTSYWFHFHIRADVRSSSSWTDSSSLYEVQMKSLLDRWQVLTVKTGAIPKDVAMHSSVTMRLKGWKGSRSDHSCGGSDNFVFVLSGSQKLFLLWHSGFEKPLFFFSCLLVLCWFYWPHVILLRGGATRWRTQYNFSK